MIVGGDPRQTNWQAPFHIKPQSDAYLKAQSSAQLLQTVASARLLRKDNKATAVLI